MFGGQRSSSIGALAPGARVDVTAAGGWYWCCGWLANLMLPFSPYVEEWTWYGEEDENKIFAFFSPLGGGRRSGCVCPVSVLCRRHGGLAMYCQALGMAWGMLLLALAFGHCVVWFVGLVVWCGCCCSCSMDLAGS